MLKSPLLRLPPTLHQSYFVVALSLGVIAGTILGLVFRLNYFVSPVWLVLVVILFLVTYFQPKTPFLAFALIAGLLLAFFRVAEVSTSSADSQASFSTDTDSHTFEEDWLLASRDWFGKRVKAAFTSVSGEEGASAITADTSAITTDVSAHPPDNSISDSSSSPSNGASATSASGTIESGLALSYLLGLKTDLSDELSDNLKTIGLIHIVVASGTHLSILVSIVQKIFQKISRFLSLLFSGLFIILFMALIGFTPSILRAGLMSLLTLVAKFSGRQIAAWRLILIVAAITLIINPHFIFSLGWLLSFASYTGIMILGPQIIHFYYGDKKPKFIASALITTISATLMTLPITLYYFGQISLISVVANLLILPTLPLAMGLTFVMGVVANIPFVSFALAFLTTQLLDFHIFVVNFFASQNSFLITIPPYRPQVFLFYLIIPLFILARILFRQVEKQKPPNLANYD